jgi:hypothetical protein
MRIQMRTDRPGVTIPIVAVMLLGILGILGLAIDLGMAYTAHAEAQRVADASALAGASAYLDYVDPYMAVGDAGLRARDFAARNTVRNQPVDTVNDLLVEVLPAEQKVRVSVQRTGLPTWFAALLGVDSLAVSAKAAAAALNDGSAKCVKPWAVMDLWREGDGTPGSCGQDTDCDGWWDDGEQWEYDPASGDYYERAEQVGDPAPATGYGSSARDGRTGDGVQDDWGREINLKSPDPNSEYVPSPGVFLPWRMPEDDGTFGAGAADYRNNISTCNNATIYLSDDDGDPADWNQYPLELGNMVGPTFQGVRDLIAEDPGARWDESTQSVVGSAWGETTGNNQPWLASPRVMVVGLINPDQIVGSGAADIHFNNFAMLFLEEQQGMQDAVTARFLYYVNGAGDTGTATGSLVKTLRLVE